MKSQLRDPNYPIKPPLTAAGVFVQAKTGQIGIVPGLGSAKARPTVKEMYR